eukprot:scaffold9877_cov256-Chaetoceros_neogracile.AAC.2
MIDGEQNYLYHHGIVEIHNTWSSLAGISLFGLIGLIKGNATREKRYFLAYLTLFLIGVGSAGLHGTLHWVFQSSDVLMNFMIVEQGSPNGNPKYPRLPAFLSALVAVNTMGIGGRITRNMNFSSLFIYLGASVFWMVDMFYCDISSLGYGMTFHVIWHFGAGFGAYLGIVSMENCRCVALRKSCELRYISGFIPYMKLVQAPKVN